MNINMDVIKKISSIDWFAHCGDSSPINISQNYMFVNNSGQAFRELQSIKWENYTLEMENELTSYLSNNCKESYQCWNRLVNKIKSEIYPSLFHQIKVAAVERFADDEKKIVVDLEWNLLGIIMAYSYADYFHSTFYDDLLKIYTSGHIVCGVKGKDSKTYLLIY